jgi:caffeoyl-CoA O-methyltransferase
MEGSAREILGQLPKKSFDVVFIDGSKQDYLEYALKSEGLLSDRGIIIVDDIFFHGDALNDEPATEKGAGCRKLLDHYEHDDKFTKVVLPISNGILLLVSKTIGK